MKIQIHDKYYVSHDRRSIIVFTFQDWYFKKLKEKNTFRSFSNYYLFSLLHFLSSSQSIFLFFFTDCINWSCQNNIQNFQVVVQVLLDSIISRNFFKNFFSKALHRLNIRFQKHLVDFTNKLSFLFIIYKFVVTAVITNCQNCIIVGTKSTNTSRTTGNLNFTETPFGSEIFG